MGLFSPWLNITRGVFLCVWKTFGRKLKSEWRDDANDRKRRPSLMGAKEFTYFDSKEVLTLWENNDSKPFCLHDD